MARRRKRRKGSPGLSELRADLMKCGRYKTKAGVLRCAKMLRGPGRPVNTKRKRKYHYTTAAGRKYRSKRR